MMSFTAEISMVGANPHFILPDEVFEYILSKTDRSKSRYPVIGSINNFDFNLTLVKNNIKGVLYISKSLIEKANINEGKMINIEIDFNKIPDRSIMNEKLIQALNENDVAKLNFERLSILQKKEMIRQINIPKVAWKIDHLINDLINNLNKRNIH